MNRQEAYSILELNEDATKDEAKSAFRKLAKQLHPDNKETGDEAKFKQINEAYNRINNDDFPSEHGGFGNGNWSSGFDPFAGTNMSDFFSSFFGNAPHGPFESTVPNVIETYLNVPYEVSVKGGQANINIKRNKKCAACNGIGGTYIKNSCKECNNTGVQTARMGNVTIRRTCGACGGRVASLDKCKSCGGTKVSPEEANINIHIPPGVISGNILNMQGAGGWCGTDGNGNDYFGNLHIKLNVQSHELFTTHGRDVHSKFIIPLLDALKGANHFVATVYGGFVVSIPPRTKHLDKVTIKGHGVAGRGDHVVTLQVEYPENLDNLIEVMSE
jgi:molecular chaperone DnaJ